MKSLKYWTKRLLLIHLFVCCIWFYLMQEYAKPQMWMIHVLVWSVLVVQFTWGLTVGMMVGPGRARRAWLWLSLLTLTLPVYFVGGLVRIIFHFMGPLYALAYLGVLSAILACETFAGVMLGVKIHARGRDEEF